MAKQMVVGATARHTATVIFSHGLGDSASGWYPWAVSLKSQFPHIKWVLPSADNHPVTLNGGMPMPSWFDIKTLTPPHLNSGPSMEDESGMLQSARRIQGLINDELDSGIPSERIVVAGFSQGAVVALITGITSERKLGGIMSLSGFLGLSQKIASMQTDHARKLPIFWGHGKADQVVQYTWGKASVEKLKELQFENIEFNSYPGMGHTLGDQESSDIEVWIRKILPSI